MIYCDFQPEGQPEADGRQVYRCTNCPNGVRCHAHQLRRKRCRANDGVCPHLGQATGATVLCNGCRGTVKIKVFACAVFDQGCLPTTKAGKATTPALPKCDGCRCHPAQACASVSGETGSD